METLNSKMSPNSIDGSPFDDFGFNYLWRLHGLGKYVPAFSGMCVIKTASLNTAALVVSMALNLASSRLCEA